MLANFQRGRGDYMGIAGNLNDKADVTAPVISYWPNDYGLYHMGGNVSEWVMDVYRPLSSEDFDDFRPFRGNVFKTTVLNSEGATDDKLDEALYDVPGIVEYLVDFTAARETRVAGVVSDSLDSYLLDTVKSAIGVANELFLDGRKLDASIAVREVMETLIPDIVANVQGTEGLENFQFELVPKIKKGISDFVMNTPGNIKTREITAEENLDRRNYQQADYIDYLDGDLTSSIYYENGDVKEKINEFDGQTDLAERNRSGQNPNWVMYKSGGNEANKPRSLIHDHSRVFKGGSWRDRAYWMNPGTRRYYDEHRSTDFIGFRCAMTRVGSPTGIRARRR